MKTAPPSNRKFGLFFALVFAAAAVSSTFKGHSPWVVRGEAVLSVAMLAAAGIRPAVLAPLNRAWFALGMAIARVTNPVVLALMYFLVFTPVAFAMRLAGRDALRIRRRAISSYWIDRSQGTPDPASFQRQF